MAKPKNDDPMKIICDGFRLCSDLATRQGAGDINVELDKCVERLVDIDKPKTKTEE